MAYDIKFLRGSQTTYEGLATKDDKTFYFTTATEDGKTVKRLYIGDVELSNTDAAVDIDELKSRLDIAEGNIGSTTALQESLKAAITRIDGDDETTGSILNAIKTALALLDGTAMIASKTGKKITVKAGVAQTAGKIANNSDADIEFADVASTGAAEDVTTTAIDDGDAENPATLYTAGNVQGILEAIARDLNDLGVESGVTVEKQTVAETGFASTYVIKQNNTQVGDKINIPLDYLVKGAEVKTVATADDPYTGAKIGDKYIDFTVNVKEGSGGTESHLYIPVNDLMKAITGGTNAETTVAISDTNEITVTINKIAASKIVYKEADATEGTAEVTVAQALDTLNGADTVEGSVKKAVKDKTGDLDDLDTTAKNNLVAAINEVRNSATGVTGVETPGASEGTDGSIKVTSKAADGTITTTYATPKNLQTVATTGDAGDVTFTPDETSDIAATDVNAAILELEDDYQAAINDLTGSAVIASETDGVVTIKAGVTETAGVVGQATGSDITLNKVATTGAAEDVSYDNTTSGLTATDAQGAIDEIAGNIDGMDGTAVIASKTGNVVTIKAGIAQTAGEIDNNSDADIVLDDVAVTGKAADLELEADATSGLAAGSVQAFAQTVTDQLTWGTF